MRCRRELRARRFSRNWLWRLTGCVQDSDTPIYLGSVHSLLISTVYRYNGGLPVHESPQYNLATTLNIIYRARQGELDGLQIIIRPTTGGKNSVQNYC